MSTSTRPLSILAYAKDLRRWDWPPNEQAVSAIETIPVVDPGPVKRAIRVIVPASVLPFAQMACTRMIMPLTKRRLLQQRDSGRDLRVQFGCGSRALPGWINIDLLGSSANFHWDLRRPMPLPDCSATAVYHEHFLEHLPFYAALGSLQEAFRLLAPGGVFRIGVPDFGRYCHGYLDDADDFLERMKPERPTPCLAINEFLYWYGHRSMWDAETLVPLLGELGFVDARRREFGESHLDPCPDWEIHESETLYIEARKP